MADQKVSVGRIVHFHEEPFGADREGALRDPMAAIVTASNPDGTVDLIVFDPERGIVTRHHASMGGPDGTVPTATCWTWPPRV